MGAETRTFLEFAVCPLTASCGHDVPYVSNRAFSRNLLDGSREGSGNVYLYNTEGQKETSTRVQHPLSVLVHILPQATPCDGPATSSAPTNVLIKGVVFLFPVRKSLAAHEACHRVCIAESGCEVEACLSQRFWVCFERRRVRPFKQSR